jgi:hypothetical protein
MVNGKWCMVNGPNSLNLTQDQVFTKKGAKWPFSHTNSFTFAPAFFKKARLRI